MKKKAAKKRTALEIRDGSHGLWLQPPGWQQSAVYVSKPHTDELPLIPLHGESHIHITAQGQKYLTPDQARQIAATLRKAADIAEGLQRDYLKRKKHGKS